MPQYGPAATPGFSVRKDEFEKFCQKAMKETEETSIYGKNY